MKLKDIYEEFLNGKKIMERKLEEKVGKKEVGLISITLQSWGKKVLLLPLNGRTVEILLKILKSNYTS